MNDQSGLCGGKYGQRMREPESREQLLWSGLKSPRRFCHVPEAATNLLGSILRHRVYTHTHTNTWHGEDEEEEGAV